MKNLKLNGLLNIFLIAVILTAVLTVFISCSGGGDESTGGNVNDETGSIIPDGSDAADMQLADEEYSMIEERIQVADNIEDEDMNGM